MANVIHVGTDNLKSLLTVIFMELERVIKLDQNKDGKISLGEWTGFVTAQFSILFGSGIFQAISAVGAEAKDLDDAEIEDLITWAKDNFPLVAIGNEKTRAIITETFNVASALYHLYEAFHLTTNIPVSVPKHFGNVTTGN